MKPYSPASERNRDPILQVLRGVFAECRHVLEIGSGTGQHAVYFSQALPHLVWQTSDLRDRHAGIREWIEASALENVLPPIALDVNEQSWPVTHADAAFTANTLHIVSWPSVRNLFAGAGELLPGGAPFCIYGPFNYRGAFTSASNAGFDATLRAGDAESGIRDFEKVCELARHSGFDLEADHEMPANNRLIVLRRRMPA